VVFVVGRSSFVADPSSLVLRRWSFVAGPSSLVLRPSSSVVRRSSLVVRRSSKIAMTTTIPEKPGYDIFRRDRPGWIPEWVGDDWNPHPYAYQTEEELMPAGRFHSRYMKLLSQLFDPLLERLGLYLLLDVFIFYRDWEGRKQRIAPDALIAPVFTELDDEQAARSYDLDVEPTPLCVIELTSPESHERDQDRKPFAYALLGIKEYLLLDIVDTDGKLRPQVGVTLWRLDERGYTVVEPDAEGFVTLDTIGVRLRADGRRLIALVVGTNEQLHTAMEMQTALEETQQQVAIEAKARQQAEEELERLRAELERLRKSQG
jgi:Uma2 family endonuclease